MKTEDYLIGVGNQIREKVEMARNKKKVEEMEMCSFHPELNEMYPEKINSFRSQKIVVEKQKLNPKKVTKFEQLYQEAKYLQQKKKDQENNHEYAFLVSLF